MDELKKAYEIMGLPENASREEVEKRYDRLLRQERQQRRRREEGEEIGETPINFDEINRAYRTIMKHEEQKLSETIAQSQYGKYKRFSGQMQKLDHFFTYYKWHLVIGIAVIAFIIYGINAYLDRQAEQKRLASLPPADLEAAFIGMFYLTDGHETEALEEALVQQIPGWQRMIVRVFPLNMSGSDPMDIAMQQRVVIEFATESPDVYIMDKHTFEWIARNQVLTSLDAEVEGRLKELLPEGAAKKAFIPDRDAVTSNPDKPIDELPGEEHYYGIDISASPLLKELPLRLGEMIVGIRPDTENWEKAIEFIARHLEAIGSTP